jgi:hypothetical protein
MLPPRLLQRIDPDTVILLAVPAYIVALGLHLSGIIALPPLLFWIAVLSLPLAAVHFLRLKLDARYKVKRETTVARWKANQLAGRPQLTTKQAKQALVLTLFIGIGVTGYRLAVDGASLPATAITSLTMLAGVYSVYRWQSRPSGHD